MLLYQPSTNLPYFSYSFYFLLWKLGLSVPKPLRIVLGFPFDFLKSIKSFSLVGMLSRFQKSIAITPPALLVYPFTGVLQSFWKEVKLDALVQYVVFTQYHDL